MQADFFPEPVKTIDARIRAWSHKSDKAPSDFLEAECRRLANLWLVRGWTRDIPTGHRRSFDAGWFESLRKRLEWEYQAYFERDAAEKTLRPNHWWQNVYAGCNAQIEHFLIDNGFAEAAETLGWTDPWQSVRSVEKSSVPEPIWRYLIGIGYLYPEEDWLHIHPNVIRAQRDGLDQTTDSAFLTRDLIRCSHHQADAAHHWTNNSDPLSNIETWAYWSDLAALSIAWLPEHILYSVDHFRDASKRDAFVQWHLDAGKKLIPQRYIELAPRIEAHEWFVPDECPENPRWR